MNNHHPDHFITLTKTLFNELYSNKNPHLIIQYLSKDIKSYGLLFEKKVCTYQNICDYFHHICQSPNHLEMQNEHFSIVSQTKDICVIDGIYELIKNKEPESSKCYHLTIVYIIQENNTFIKHIHVSIPYQTKTNDQLRYNHFDIKGLFDQSNMAGLYCSYLDELHTYYFINDALALMLGYDNQEDFLNHCHCAISAIYFEDRNKIKNDIYRYLTFGNIYNVEYRMQKKDGSIIWVMEQGQRFYDEHNNELIHAFISDISGLKKSELDLMIQKQKYSLALKDNSITILEYDIANDRLIIDIQVESKKKIYDHYLDYVSSDHSTVFKDDRHLVVDLFTQKIKGPIEIREHIRGTNQYVRKSIDATIIYDTYGKPAIVLATARDITTEWNQKYILEQKIQKDSLTQLLNLESGKKKIESYLQHKSIQNPTALLVLDIDYFKTINDNHGHFFGNMVLIRFAECLTSMVRQKDIVARIGGDEFIILLKDMNKQAVINKVENICQKIRSLQFDENLTMTTSIGVCFLPAYQTCSFEQLFKNADRSLYQAKENGRNGFHICSYIDSQEHKAVAKKTTYDELYHKVLEIFNQKNQNNFMPIFHLITKHYQINRISLININKDNLHYTHENLCVSSRAYQNDCIDGMINKNDMSYFMNNDYIIIHQNESLPLSYEFQKILMQGVSKIVLVICFHQEHQVILLSYAHYEFSKEWTNEEIQEITELSRVILPQITTSH